MTMTRTAAEHAPRWAVGCAWAVPLTILPSALWRASVVFRDGDWRELIVGGGWYLLFLSLLSLGLGVLTVGLVRPWGEVWPRWVPFMRGREVPARAVATVARIGASVLILLPIYVIVYSNFAPFEVQPMINPDGEVHAKPGMDILSLYLPMLAWGPLLFAVATDYHRRRVDMSVA